MPLHLCGPGYQCVSHVKAFGLGHTPDVAARRVNWWSEKMSASLHAVVGKNGAREVEADGKAYSALAKELQQAEQAVISRTGEQSAEPIYEVGCPFKGKSLGFGTAAGGAPACYPNDSSTLFIPLSYEESICRNEQHEEGSPFKPCLCVLKAAPGMERSVLDLKKIAFAQPTDNSPYLAYHKLAPLPNGDTDTAVPLIEQPVGAGGGAGAGGAGGTAETDAVKGGLIVVPHYYMPRQGADMFAQSAGMPAFGDKKSANMLWGNVFQNKYKKDMEKELSSLEADMRMSMAEYNNHVSGDDPCPKTVTIGMMQKAVRIAGEYEHWRERCEAFERSYWQMQNPNMTAGEWKAVFKAAPKCDFAELGFGEYTKFRRAMQHCAINVRTDAKDVAVLSAPFRVAPVVAKGVAKADGGPVPRETAEDSDKGVMQAGKDEDVEKAANEQEVAGGDAAEAKEAAAGTDAKEAKKKADAAAADAKQPEESEAVKAEKKKDKKAQAEEAKAEKAEDDEETKQAKGSAAAETEEKASEQASKEKASEQAPKEKGKGATPEAKEAGMGSLVGFIGEALLSNVARLMENSQGERLKVKGRPRRKKRMMNMKQDARLSSNWLDGIGKPGGCSLLRNAAVFL
eukprot:g809.t1